jgi:hypothetical protein
MARGLNEAASERAVVAEVGEVLDRLEDEALDSASFLRIFRAPELDLFEEPEERADSLLPEVRPADFPL